MKRKVTTEEKTKLRNRIKKMMIGVKEQSNLRFNYKLSGSIKPGNPEMSVDAQGRVDIDIDILIMLKKTYPDAQKAYQKVLSEIKKSLKQNELHKSKKRVIKINRPEFTIDIAIVDPFSEKGKRFILKNENGNFKWTQD